MNAVVVFAFLIAGISAALVPGSETQPVDTRSERLISDTIIELIEDISQDIRDAGFDPLQVEKESFIYELPVPVIFNAVANVENVLSTGISDIVVNSMNYSLLFFRLNFDIELPHIHVSARSANGKVTVFGRSLEAEGDGSVDIRGIRVVGEARVSVGISGISISRVTIDLNIGSIRSNIRLAVQGQNFSHDINNLISSTIPDILKEFKAEVDELIEIILLDVINEIL